MMPRQKAGPGSDNANVKKTDVWVPGSTRNPETYILKDQGISGRATKVISKDENVAKNWGYF
ncbi:hypothetical protein CK203_055898 [Vitis vinifera]|uniref:Uncharacterized protein n=1 Tax=Vitis vinifera TaxID=29760 RepID=A0A438FTY3_VITVI|nr:hypothetical protein CK203_055898 [Vitis vinifera]